MDRLSLDARIAIKASKQFGLITREQVLALGGTPRIIERRICKKTWIRVHSGVYRIAATPATFEQSLLAACLAASSENREAVVSHLPAGTLWKFPGFVSGVPEITIPRGGSFRASGVRTHVTRSLPPKHRTSIGVIPVTTAARTLLDVAGRVDREFLEAATDEALRRNLVTLQSMEKILSESGPLAGSADLRKIIRQRQPGTIPRSVLETKFFSFCAKYRLPRPVSQYPVRLPNGVMSYIDWAYPDLLIAIETDGEESHSGWAQLRKDKARANALTRLGWRIHTFVWADLRDRPAEVSHETLDLINVCRRTG